MRLVWSQPSSREDRPKALMLLAVVCLFLGGAVVGRPVVDQPPRPFRAAVASLLATGGVLFIVGGAALVVRKSRRSPPPLSLAPSQREEDQR
jgi:hypothetical protein